MTEDQNLELLRELAGRADASGIIELASNEVPFALSRNGMAWLKQTGWRPERYRLTDHGNAVLR